MIMLTAGGCCPPGQEGLRSPEGVAGQCKMVQHAAQTSEKGTDWIAI
jgi:hypothetical protein